MNGGFGNLCEISSFGEILLCLRGNSDTSIQISKSNVVAFDHSSKDVFIQLIVNRYSLFFWVWLPPVQITVVNSFLHTKVNSIFFRLPQVINISWKSFATLSTENEIQLMAKLRRFMIQCFLSKKVKNERNKRNSQHIMRPFKTKEL